jgi:hypothetical protein
MIALAARSTTTSALRTFKTPVRLHNLGATMLNYITSATTRTLTTSARLHNLGAKFATSVQSPGWAAHVRPFHLCHQAHVNNLCASPQPGRHVRDLCAVTRLGCTCSTISPLPSAR